MVCHVINVWRKGSLVLVMHPDCNVGPPEKSLNERSAIEQPGSCLHYTFSRTKSDPHHPLHTVHGLVLAQPDCLASIPVFFDCVIHRHERRGTVMLWPVKLDAA